MARSDQKQVKNGWTPPATTICRLAYNDIAWEFEALTTCGAAAERRRDFARRAMQ
jgi:hypothetical protein